MALMDSDLRKAILAKADVGEREGILESKGYKSMFKDGQRLVAEGITTTEELNKACGILLENQSD